MTRASFSDAMWKIIEKQIPKIPNAEIVTRVTPNFINDVVTQALREGDTPANAAQIVINEHASNDGGGANEEDEDETPCR